MKTVGLIAEYNPFHMGHRYHIEQAKKIAGADAAVVVMSGDFVQRGEPAVVDKYTRAHMALLGGADLIVELPMLYATASAERFALGAVGMLHFLGVDAICFGSECGDIDALMTAADVLADEPPEFKALLRQYAAEGNSFPKARQMALEGCLGRGSDILSNPNNLLGVEYIKALKHFSSSMHAYTIQRKGLGYNDTELKYALAQQGNECDGSADKSIGFASSSAIRAFFNKSKTDDKAYKTGGGISADALRRAAECIPTEARPVFTDAVTERGILTADDFSQLLNYKLYCLMREDSTQLMNYYDVSEPLANKITKIYDREHFTGDFTTLVMKLKSKDTTYTGISRALLHILLDIKLDAWSCCMPYARVLGMNPKGQSFLSSIKKTCPVPIITKAADASELLRNDIFAANVYNQVMYRKYGSQPEDDYRHLLVKIS